MDPTEFGACYHYCTLTRNLQILGAFGYLSKVKGKHHFEDYIPAAVRSLQTNLMNRAPKEFSGLVDLVQRIAEHLKIAKTD
jgi:aminoglycoside/choline kinase family phosphotransferase